MTSPTRKMIETYELLKDGKSHNFENMVAKLGCKPVTAMVLICALRRDCGADIETERDGRKVEAYRLNNAAEIAPLMVLAPKKGKVKKVAKVAKPKAPMARVAKPSKIVAKATKVQKEPDVEVPTLEIEEINDRELADLKAELGLGGPGYSE